MSDNDFDFDIPEKTGTCSACGHQGMVTEVENEFGEYHDLYFCHDCCENRGFCFGCGKFSAGTSAYDLSEMGAYCEECQYEIRTTMDLHDDDFSEYFDD